MEDKRLDARGMSTVQGYTLQGSFDSNVVAGALPLYGIEEPVYPLGSANDAVRWGPRFTIRTS
ncbi:MAG: hypothetical protein ACOYU7_01480 [Bacillota bacterium]